MVSNSRSMKILPTLLACLVMAVTPSLVLAADGWETNYEAALAQAAKENKPLLLDFTGSDWCGACIALSNKVFSTKEFKDWAKNNVVLVELDFPQKPQAPDLARQNMALQSQYGIEGFPTLVLLNAKGKEITRKVGYGGESPAEFIAWAQKATK